MKKWTSVFLAVILVMALLCSAAFADEAPQPEGGKKFETYRCHPEWSEAKPKDLSATLSNFCFQYLVLIREEYRCFAGRQELE